MIVVNDPYLSGTHLNDVTVIRAIYPGAPLGVALRREQAHRDRRRRGAGPRF